nr:MAG TPA: hypothetical protein [Caudoviricetes sp.]
MRFLTKRIEAAGFRVCRFSFCTICGIITPTKSTRPLEEAQQGGYLPASPVLYLGMKKAVAR